MLLGGSFLEVTLHIWFSFIMYGYWLLLFLFNQKYKKSFFDLEKENKAIKDRGIRDFRNLFEQKEDYYIITNQKERVISAAIITSNMKIMVTEIKHYPLNNMVMKLGHT